ncbi:uncharacterized protein NPIL_82541 [Nephila pilipes]|uniref:Uncharacterized protein n=1 Tax=Nephila pilipes TaxID=299642 RepID=A0A8X6PDH1_NEPPI|nr:uncharacterized protein NPIL_82541 [Nephila pilipes]
MESSYIMESENSKQENLHYKKQCVGGFIPSNLRQTSNKERFQSKQFHCRNRKITHFSECSSDVRRIINDLSGAKKALKDDKRLDSRSKHKYDKIFGETLVSILRACPDAKQNLKNAKISPIPEIAFSDVCNAMNLQDHINDDFVTGGIHDVQDKPHTDILNEGRFQYANETISSKSWRRSEGRHESNHPNPHYLKCKIKDSIFQNDSKDHFKKFNPQSSNVSEFKNREKHMAENIGHENKMKMDKRNRKDFPDPMIEYDSSKKMHEFNGIQTKSSSRDAFLDEQLRKDLRDFARSVNDSYVEIPQRKSSTSFNKLTYIGEESVRNMDKLEPFGHVASNRKVNCSVWFDAISAFEPDSMDELLSKESRGFRRTGNEFTESDTNLKADMKIFIKEFCPPNFDLEKCKSGRFKYQADKQNVDTMCEDQPTNRQNYLRRRNYVRPCYCSSESACNKKSTGNRNDYSPAKENIFESVENELSDNRYKGRRNRRKEPPENIFESLESSDTHPKDESFLQNILGSSEQKRKQQKYGINLNLQNDKHGEGKSDVFKNSDEFFEEFDKKCFRSRDRTRKRNEKYLMHLEKSENFKSQDLYSNPVFIEEKYKKVMNEEIDNHVSHTEEILECVNSKTDMLFLTSNQLSSENPKSQNNAKNLNNVSKEELNKDNSRYKAKMEKQMTEVVPTDQKTSELKIAAEIQGNKRKNTSLIAITTGNPLLEKTTTNHLHEQSNATVKDPNVALVKVKSEECQKESTDFKDEKLNPDNEMTVVSQLINTVNLENKDDIIEENSPNTEMECLKLNGTVQGNEQTKETVVQDAQTEIEANTSAEHSKSTISAFLDQHSSESGKQDDLQETLLDKVQRWKDSCCNQGRTNSVSSSSSSKEILKKFNLGNTMVSTIYGSPKKNFDLEKETIPVKNTLISGEVHHRRQWNRPLKNRFGKIKNGSFERMNEQQFSNCEMTIKHPFRNPSQELYNMSQRNHMFNFQQECLESPLKPQNINRINLGTKSQPVDSNIDMLGMNVQHPTFETSGPFEGIYPQYPLLLNYMNPLGMLHPNIFLKHVSCNPVGSNFVCGLSNNTTENIVPDPVNDNHTPNLNITNAFNSIDNGPKVSHLKHADENRSSLRNINSRNGEIRLPSNTTDCKIKEENGTVADVCHILKTGCVSEAISDKMNLPAGRSMSGEKNNFLFNAGISQPKDLFKAIKVKLTSGRDMASILMHGESKSLNLEEGGASTTKRIYEPPESYEEVNSVSMACTTVHAEIKRNNKELTRRPKGIVPGLDDLDFN